jgi:hypothetical protein
MAALANVISAVPGGWDRGPAERIALIAASESALEARVWRLWLEAHWATNVGSHQLAHHALDIAERLAKDMVWTPIWGLESNGLRAKLYQDGGEPARAYEPLLWAMRGWLQVGNTLDHPTREAADLVTAIFAGAHAMVTAAVDLAYLERLVPEGDATLAAGSLWMADRLSSEAAEIITRAVNLTAQVGSYADARRAANDALAETRKWRAPWWQQVEFEIGLRLTLSTAAGNEQRFGAALGQTDDGLVLVGQLPPGPQQARLTAELRANRATALLLMERSAEAAAEFDRAREGFLAIGATADALRIATAAKRAQEGAGEAVSSETLRRLVSDMEEAIDNQSGGHGDLMVDLEDARRWWLSMLAEARTNDIETIVGIIERLRDDQPNLRSGGEHADAVVKRVSRPFTVLAARLGMLPDTALIVLEPGLSGARERAPVFLVVSSRGPGDALRCQLTQSHEAGVALNDLGRQATAEREALLTGEVSLRAAPSTSLTSAAAAAWAALPAEVRDAIRSARTLIYMPSAAGNIDAIPFELLRHEAGWLGTTHVVARCPSFQVLEMLLAPNARRPAEDTRALVAAPAQDPVLGWLDEAEAEVKLALDAATLLGLEPERRLLNQPDTVLDAFTGHALVHYVGHGFANPIGELLPLSGDNGVTASELPEDDGGPAPFTFFNACLLGRVRHIPGGRQQGWALRLLRRGAPAIVGALAAVPDSACVAVAEAFYEAALRAPVGEAMRRARAHLDEAGLHPLVWAAYVLHGDPNAGISTQVPNSSADQVCSWPALATRLLATGLPRHRAELLEALKSAPHASDVIATWATGASVAEDNLAAAIGMLLERNPEGAAVCRILLALARLDRDSDNVKELEVAYLCAAALQDGYGVLHVLGVNANAWNKRCQGGQDALQDTALRWLTALSGARKEFAGLEARLARR